MSTEQDRTAPTKDEPDHVEALDSENAELGRTAPEETFSDAEEARWHIATSSDEANAD